MRPHRLTVECRGVVQKCIAVVVDDGLQRDTQLLAVAEDSSMVLWDACGTRIEVGVLAAGPADRLRALALLDPVATAQRPAATARTRAGLEHNAIEASLGELESRRHAGNAGAKDDDATSAPGTRRQDRRSGVGSGRRQQSHGGHRAVDGRRPTRAPGEIDEGAARQRWL
jgi:hypothetical protein